MALNIILESRALRPVVIDVPYSLFSSENQSVIISSSSVGPGVFNDTTRIADVLVYKDTPFDANSVEFGHLSTSGGRDSIATSAEVDAVTAGVSKPDNWRGEGKFADLTLTGNRGIYARSGAGALATTGLIRLVLMVYDVSPRSII